METLAARVARQGSLHERDAVGWVIRLCKRVEELHRHGVAHGGISADVVFTETHDCTSPGQLRDEGQAAMPPAYHSPERIAGHGVSQADDTWAIAVTLYFLLTGTMPFAGDTPSEVQERLTRAPAPLAVFDVGDDSLQAILNRFLSPGMGQRVVQTPALRDALSRWKHGVSVAHLPALEETIDDGFGDYDDEDDDEEEVQTVMRDFSDVREHLKRMDSGAKPRPAAGAPAARPRPAPAAPPGAFAGRPPVVGPGRPNTATPAMGLPQGIPQGRGPGAGPPARPRPAPIRPAAGAPPAARISSPGGGAAPAFKSASQPLPGAPGYGIDDDESDEDVRTVLMDADQADLSAAIEEALAAKAAQKRAPSGPPPGWPPPAGAAEDDDSMAPTAHFDASMLPDGMMPDPLGGPPDPTLPTDPPPAPPAPPLESTVDKLLNDIPPPPPPPEHEPAFGGLGGPGLGPGLSPGPGPGPPGGGFGPPVAAGPSGLGVGTPAPRHSLQGIPGLVGSTVVEEPRSGLRTALIVAIVVLVIVVLAVVALYLDRRGIVDLGLPRSSPTEKAVPSAAPSTSPSATATATATATASAASSTSAAPSASASAATSTSTSAKPKKKKKK